MCNLSCGPRHAVFPDSHALSPWLTLPHPLAQSARHALLLRQRRPRPPARPRRDRRRQRPGHRLRRRPLVAAARRAALRPVRDRGRHALGPDRHRRRTASRSPRSARRTAPSSATATRISRTTRAAPPASYTAGAKLILADGDGAKLTPATIDGRARPDPRRRPPRPAARDLDHQRDRIRPRLHSRGSRRDRRGRPGAPPRPPHGRRALRQRARARRLFARRRHLARRRRRAEPRLRQERRHVGGGLWCSSARSSPATRSTAASGRGCSSPRGGSLPRRCWRCSTDDLWLANARAANAGAALLARSGGRPTGPPGRSERSVPAPFHGRSRGEPARARLRLL